MYVVDLRDLEDFLSRESINASLETIFEETPLEVKNGSLRGLSCFYVTSYANGFKSAYELREIELKDGIAAETEAEAAVIRRNTLEIVGAAHRVRMLASRYGHWMIEAFTGVPVDDTTRGLKNRYIEQIIETGARYLLGDFYDHEMVRELIETSFPQTRRRYVPSREIMQ